MGQPNFEKMLRLADEVFSVRNDPTQLNVTPEVIARLQRLHPATLSDHQTPSIVVRHSSPRPVGHDPLIPLRRA